MAFDVSHSNNSHHPASVRTVGIVVCFDGGFMKKLEGTELPSVKSTIIVNQKYIHNFFHSFIR